MINSKLGNRKHGILCYYIFGMEAVKNSSIFSLENCVGRTCYLSIYIVEEDKTYVINGDYMRAKNKSRGNSSNTATYKRYSDEANIQDDLIQFIRSKNIEFLNCDIIEGSSKVIIKYKDWLIDGKSVDELIKAYILKIKMLYGVDVAKVFKRVAPGLLVCDIGLIYKPVDNINIPDFCLCCCCYSYRCMVKNVNLGRYTIHVPFKDNFISIHGGSYGDLFSICKIENTTNLRNLEIPKTVTQISWKRLIKIFTLQELIFDEDLDFKSLRFRTLNYDNYTESGNYTSPQMSITQQTDILFSLRTLKLPRSIDSTGVSQGQFGNLSVLKKLIVPSMNSANEIINSVGSKEKIDMLYERISTHDLEIEIY